MITNIIFLPHGMQIIPGVEEEPLEGFRTLNASTHSLLEQVVSTTSPNVVLLTPHGYSLENNPVIYQHESYQGHIYQLEGDSVVHGSPIDQVSFQGNPELTAEILDLSTQHNLDLEVLVQGFSGYPLTLNWGEVVPLHYYQHHFPNHRYCILSYPRSRHQDLEDISHLNTKLLTVLQHIEDDITLLVSGDLSHVHDAEGPYGFDESAQKFDVTINRWAEVAENELMAEITRLQPDALACGYSGLELIHQVRTEGKYDLSASFYGVPTYFGMGGYLWQHRSG